MKPFLVSTYILLLCVAAYVPYGYVKILQHNTAFQITVLNKSDMFQWVPTTSYSFVSAYFDDRNHYPVIRILGFQSRNEHLGTPLRCKLHMTNGDAFCSKKKLEIIYLDEKQNRLWDVEVFYICRVPFGVKPIAVTLTPIPGCIGEDHMLPVRYPGPRREPSGLAACITVPENSQPQQQDLVEQIELSRLLGAESITLYMTNRLIFNRKILSFYNGDNIFNVLPWDPGDRSLHSSGATLAMNDCLYKNMAKSNYVVYLTTESIVLPEHNQTWRAMLKKYEHKDISVFLASSRDYMSMTNAYPKNMGFCDYSLQYPRLIKHNLHINNASVTKNLSLNSPSLVVVKTEYTESVSMHGSFNVLQGYTNHTLVPTEAHIHRYVKHTAGFEMKTRNIEHTWLQNKLMEQLCTVWSQFYRKNQTIFDES